ncbi:MAG: hypothetical protein ACK2T4_00820 [Candidatus Promineifilaceae bacterium]|jgi:hypothetical protein
MNILLTITFFILAITASAYAFDSLSKERESYAQAIQKVRHKSGD